MRFRDKKKVDYHFNERSGFWVVTITFANGDSTRKSFYAQSSAKAYKLEVERRQ